MTAGRRPSLLFLDIDGTLLPFGSDTTREPLGARDDSYLDRLNPQVRPGLAALPCDLIWATTWEQEANTEMAPRLGLPSLPVVHWPEPSAEREREDQWFGLHWKTSSLVEWADGRPFIWVDVSDTLKVFSLILSDAAEEKLIPTNPVRHRRRGRGRRTTTREKIWATPTQVLRIADQTAAYYGPGAGILILTAAYTGARWGELTGLRRTWGGRP